MNAIQTYTKSLLGPRLKTYGLNKEQRGLICADVQQRLESLLYHWRDALFRRTILTLGTEEATFWEPGDVSLEIRSLVVVAVRNSLLENLNAAGRFQRQVLPDADMPLLTGEAIRYFKGINLADASIDPGSDLFGSLPRRFPNAWQCLSVLAHAEADETAHAMRLEKGETLELGATRAKPAQRTVITASGIDAHIDPQLAEVLRQIQKGVVQVLGSPSFSRITRNPVKLLAILDHVVRYGGAFATPNYALSATYVARRHPLLRPVRTESEVDAVLLKTEGLCPRHAELLSVC